MDRPPLRNRLRLRTAPPKGSAAWRVLFPDDPTNDIPMDTARPAAMTPAELIAARLHAHRITSAVDRAYRAAEAVQVGRPSLHVAIDPVPGAVSEPDGHEFTPGGPFKVRFVLSAEGQGDVRFHVDGGATFEDMGRALERFTWELLDAPL